MTNESNLLPFAIFLQSPKISFSFYTYIYAYIYASRFSLHIYKFVLRYIPITVMNYLCNIFYWTLKHRELEDGTVIKLVDDLTSSVSSPLEIDKDEQDSFMNL